MGAACPCGTSRVREGPLRAVGKPDKTWILSPTPEDELAGHGYDFPEGWLLSLVSALKLVYLKSDA